MLESDGQVRAVASGVSEGVDRFNKIAVNAQSRRAIMSYFMTNTLPLRSFTTACPD